MKKLILLILLSLSNSTFTAEESPICGLGYRVPSSHDSHPFEQGGLDYRYRDDSDRPDSGESLFRAETDFDRKLREQHFRDLEQHPGAEAAPSESHLTRDDYDDQSKYRLDDSRDYYAAPREQLNLRHIGNESTLRSPLSKWMDRDGVIFPLGPRPDMSQDAKLKLLQAWVDQYDVPSIVHAFISSFKDLDNLSMLDRWNRFKVSRRISWIKKMMAENELLQNLYAIYRAENLKEAKFSIDFLEKKLAQNDQQLDAAKKAKIMQIARGLINVDFQQQGTPGKPVSSPMADPLSNFSTLASSQLALEISDRDREIIMLMGVRIGEENDTVRSLLDRSPELSERFIRKVAENMHPAEIAKRWEDALVRLREGLLTPIGSVRGRSEQGGHPVAKICDALSQIDLEKITAEQTVDLMAVLTSDWMIGKTSTSMGSYLSSLDISDTVLKASQLIPPTQASLQFASGAGAGAVAVDAAVATKIADAASTAAQATGAALETGAAGAAAASATNTLLHEGQHNGNEGGDSSANAPRSGSAPKITTKQAAAMAEELGFRKTKYITSRGERVFQKGKQFISIDVDNHSGGVWKMARSVEKLERKTTRMGTYDKFLNRIGD